MKRQELEIKDQTDKIKNYYIFKEYFILTIGNSNESIPFHFKCVFANIIMKWFIFGDRGGKKRGNKLPIKKKGTFKKKKKTR